MVCRLCAWCSGLFAWAFKHVQQEQGWQTEKKEGQDRQYLNGMPKMTNNLNLNLISCLGSCARTQTQAIMCI